MREHPDRVRHARQGNFQRNRHLLLDLFRGSARIQRNHRDLGIGNVGEGLDRQRPEGCDAATDEQQQP